LHKCNQFCSFCWADRNDTGIKKIDNTVQKRKISLKFPNGLLPFCSVNHAAEPAFPRPDSTKNSYPTIGPCTDYNIRSFTVRTADFFTPCSQQCKQHFDTVYPIPKQ